MRRALVVLAAVTGALLLPSAAVAVPPLAPPDAKQCAEPGAAAPQVPWHQKAFDPQRTSVLTRGENVKVAVVDSGVDAAHPQLKGRVAAGRNLLEPGNGPANTDCTGHGTAVASIIAGVGDGGTPFRGYAPAVQIVPFAVSEQNSDKGEAAPGTAGNLAAAIQAAVAEKVRVINISLVLYQSDPALEAAVKQAVASDIVVVASVGNLGNDGPRTPYPAAYNGVIGVGAIGPSGLRTASSPAGPWVDLMAPGEQITAAGRTSGYGVTYAGPGFAAPFVSAAAALLRSRAPGLSAADVTARLIAAADPSPGGGGRTDEYGYGIVDAYRAVAEYPAAAAAKTPAAVPVYRGEPVDPTRHRQITIAYAAGAIMIGLVVIAAAAAVWLPRGRRRRWRPGRAAPVAVAPPGDGNRRLFDDLEED